MFVYSGQCFKRIIRQAELIDYWSTARLNRRTVTVYLFYVTRLSNPSRRIIILISNNIYKLSTGYEFDKIEH